MDSMKPLEPETFPMLGRHPYSLSLCRQPNILVKLMLTNLSDSVVVTILTSHHINKLSYKVKYVGNHKLQLYKGESPSDILPQKED